MTEAELIEAAMIIAEQAASSVSLYLTTVSAYLLVAYFVGAKLKGLQTIAISTLFVIFALSFVAGIQTNLGNMVSIEQELQSLRPDWISFSSNRFNMVLLVVDTLGIIVSLYFMWDVRRPKTE